MERACGSLVTLGVLLAFYWTPVLATSHIRSLVAAFALVRITPYPPSARLI